MMLFSLVPIFFMSQKKVTHQNLIWYGYYAQIKLSKKWIWLSEVQERHFIQPFAQHQLVFRNNLRYKITANWNILMGFTNFYQSPNDPSSTSDLVIPELRPDIGLENNQTYKRLSISHRYKLEARFFHQSNKEELTGGYQYSNLRFRYQIGIDVPIIKSLKNNSELTFKLKDELMVNIGSKIIKNTFDQNRIYAALHYKINNNIGVEAGYMNWYQQKSSGDEFYSRNIVRLSLFHNL